MEESIEKKHYHSAEHNKKIINRLSKAIGHLESVKRMVEDDRDCADVLIQLAAIQAALKNTGKEIIKEHIEHCIFHAVQDGNMQALDEFKQAIDKLL